jgi:hypothetical protein
MLAALGVEHRQTVALRSGHERQRQGPLREEQRASEQQNSRYDEGYVAEFSTSATASAVAVSSLTESKVPLSPRVPTYVMPLVLKYVPEAVNSRLSSLDSHIGAPMP